MPVVSGHGASTELAATKPAVAPLPCQYTVEPAFPMAHPGGSSWLFPACKKKKKKQNSALRGDGGAVAVSESCGAPGATAVALGCFTLKNASAPQYLWPREDALEEGLPGQTPQLRKGYGSGAAGTAFPPTVGLADPLAWSSVWGSSWDPQSPAFCTGERAPPPPLQAALAVLPRALPQSWPRCGKADESFGLEERFLFVPASPAEDGCWD